MKKSIKTAVQDMHRTTKLSPTELDSLRSAESFYQQPKEQNNTTSKSSWLKQASYVATVFSVALIAFFTWVIIPGNNKTEQIFTDAIENHLSHKILDYNEKSLPALAKNFSYLGFMLLKSQPMTQIKGMLTGARPCLILSVPTAQLRYQAHDKQWVTVFQARYEKGIHGTVPDINNKQKPLIKTTNGVQVSVWQDNGLLFAMVQP